jgi:FkbM family methyltransferase
MGMVKDLLRRIVTRMLPVLQGREKGVFLISERDGRTAGLRIRWRTGEPELLEGAITTFEAWSQQFRFFIVDDADTIQSCHRRGRFYEEQELEIIARHFSGGVFADVGANVGNHAVFAAKILNAARVIAFEPHPLAAQICEINLALNHCSDAVDLRRVGLSDRVTQARLVREKHNLGGTRLTLGEGGPARLVTGDEVLLNQPVSFIKIDTEGHELHALQGLAQTIHVHRPALFVEVENTNIEAFEAFCAERKYRVAESFRRYQACLNFLALPS